MSQEAVRHRTRREIIKLTDPVKYAEELFKSQLRYMLFLCSLNQRLVKAEQQLKEIGGTSSNLHGVAPDTQHDDIGGGHDSPEHTLENPE